MITGAWEDKREEIALTVSALPRKPGSTPPTKTVRPINMRNVPPREFATARPENVIASQATLERLAPVRPVLTIVPATEPANS